MQPANVKAIVTGAGGGLGGTFALEILRAGGRVAAGDSNAAGLRRLVTEAGGNLEAGEAGEAGDGGSGGAGEDRGDRLFVAKLDITDEASVASFVDLAAERMGGLNVLINSAGIARDGLLVKRAPAAGGAVETLPLAQWRKVVDVNLTGQFLMTRAFAAHAVTAGVRDAVVVNLSSIARAGNPGQSNYAASKAGLDACTRTWALELARHGIRVGGVAPGVTETGFLEGFSEKTMDRLKAAIPLARLGRPLDIWQAVRFIIECEFFTGRTVEVDGGASMGVA
jgi:3-oxoacyl-[acyl-carrier protein] reductase